MFRWLTIALLVCSLVVGSARSEMPIQSYFEQGRYRAAVPVLQQQIQQFARQNDRINQGIALVNLAIAYRQLGEWDLAATSAEESLSFLSGQQLAHALDVRAKLHLEQGNPAAAYDRWTQGATIYQQFSDQESWYRTQADRSLALQNLGLYPRACALLWETLSLPGECNYSSAVLTALEGKKLSRSGLKLLANLGRVLQVTGELTGAEAVLNLGIKQAEKLNNPPELGLLWLNLGNTKGFLPDQYRSALEAYDRSGLLEDKVNQISLMIQQKELDKAFQLWQQIHPKIKDASVTIKINYARSGIKLISNYPQIKQQIDQLLSQTYQVAEKLQHPSLIQHTLLLQANLAELNQDFKKAQNLSLNALKLKPSDDIAYLLFAQKARIAQKMGNISQGIEDYSQAIKSLSALRQNLTNLNSDVQYNFREGVEPIYRELVSLLLQNDRPSQTQLKQARQIIDSLQLAELDNFFKDACADTKPVDIDQIDPKAAIFYPIVLKDRLELIVAIPQQPLFHTRIPVPQQILRQTIQSARNSIRLAAFPEERIAPTTKLYNWLIRPTEQLLIQHQIETLVFVPDDSLRNLPFNILWDGSKYLIEKYNLALVSSLQLVAPKPLTKQNLQVNAAGITHSRQGFPPLPAVGKELKERAQILPTNTIIDDQFTKESLRQRIDQFSAPIVHLATHGQFSSDANSSFLLTWNDRIKVKELGKILARRPDNPIELLVLSACETATSDDRANLGIAGIAVRSGARSTIASLWSAFDDSTALLMTNLYQQLTQPSINKAEALRQAQIKLLSHPIFARPYYWAPFLLLGNWQ